VWLLCTATQDDKFVLHHACLKQSDSQYKVVVA